jgi:hypothetical protein
VNSFSNSFYGPSRPNNLYTPYAGGARPVSPLYGPNPYAPQPLYAPRSFGGGFTPYTSPQRNMNAQLFY